MNRNVIITCAITGAGDTTNKSEHVPVTPEQIAEKKKQFKEMGDAWKSLSIQDRAAMIIHFMQMKMQWDSMSDEEKDEKKADMKKQWQEYLPLSPEEKKQKLENYVKSLN